MSDNEDNRLPKTEILECHDGFKLNIYHMPPEKIKSDYPAIIIFHGLSSHGQDDLVLNIMRKFSLLGFLTFSYDMRGSAPYYKEDKQMTMVKQLSPEYFLALFNDADIIVDYVKRFPKVNQHQINVIGGSLGGAIVLGKLLNRSDINKIIAMAAPYDYKQLLIHNMFHGTLQSRLVYLSAIWKIKEFRKFLRICREVSAISSILPNPERKYSDYVYLIQCKDDPIVDFRTQFMRNKEALNLPSENYIIFEDGGHSGKKYYQEITNQIQKWLSEA